MANCVASHSERLRTVGVPYALGASRIPTPKSQPSVSVFCRIHTAYVYWCQGRRLGFDWDEANVAHVARHSVTPEEVEQVFANDPMDLGADVVEGEERYTGVDHDASERLAVRYLAERGFRLWRTKSNE